MRHPKLFVASVAVVLAVIGFAIWMNFQIDRTLTVVGTSADNQILYLMNDNKTCIIVVDRKEVIENDGTVSIFLEVVPTTPAGMEFRDMTLVTPALVREGVFDDRKTWMFTSSQSDQQMNTTRHKVTGRSK